MTATITAQQVLSLGGREWVGRDGRKRIYLNNWADLAGLEVVRYGSGNIRWAAIDGEQVSNTKAAVLAGAKVWYDVETGELRHTIRRAAEDARIDVADTLIGNLIAAIRRAGAREMTTAQAAQELGVSARTVRRWAAVGKLSARKNARGHWVILL